MRLLIKKKNLKGKNGPACGKVAHGVGCGEQPSAIGHAKTGIHPWGVGWSCATQQLPPPPSVGETLK